MKKELKMNSTNSLGTFSSMIFLLALLFYTIYDKNYTLSFLSLIPISIVGYKMIFFNVLTVNSHKIEYQNLWTKELVWSYKLDEINYVKIITVPKFFDGWAKQKFVDIKPIGKKTIELHLYDFDKKDALRFLKKEGVKALHEEKGKIKEY